MSVACFLDFSVRPSIIFLCWASEFSSIKPTFFSNFALLKDYKMDLSDAGAIKRLDNKADYKVPVQVPGE